MSPTDLGHPDRSSAAQMMATRVIALLDQRAYVVAVMDEGTDPEAALSLQRLVRAPVLEPSELLSVTESLFQAGRITLLSKLEWQAVGLSRPDVRRWEEASERLDQMEALVQAMDGEQRGVNLSAIARHRGVIACLNGEVDEAYEYFREAIDRCYCMANIHNLLVIVLRRDGLDDAQALLSAFNSRLPEPAVATLQRLVQSDPDLIPLRHRGSNA